MLDSISLKLELLRSMCACMFEKPLATQQRATRPIVLGRDAIEKSPRTGG